MRDNNKIREVTNRPEPLFRNSWKKNQFRGPKYRIRLDIDLDTHCD